MNSKGHVKATTDVIEYLGADTFVIVNADTLGGVRIRCESNSKLEKGLKIGLKFELSKIHFFDQEGINLNIWYWCKIIQYGFSFSVSLKVISSLLVSNICIYLPMKK